MRAPVYALVGFVLWMLLNHMGRDRMLSGIRDFFERYHDNPDHPVLQDFLAVQCGIEDMGLGVHGGYLYVSRY